MNLVESLGNLFFSDDFPDHKSQEICSHLLSLQTKFGSNPENVQWGQGFETPRKKGPSFWSTPFKKFVTFQAFQAPHLNQQLQKLESPSSHPKKWTLKSCKKTQVLFQNYLVISHTKTLIISSWEKQKQSKFY